MHLQINEPLFRFQNLILTDCKDNLIDSGIVHIKMDAL